LRVGSVVAREDIMSAAISIGISNIKYRVGESRTERARRLQPELDREYIVPVLLKSVQVLELLGKAPDGLRIEQIHQRTGFAKTTVYRIVRTLVVSGYLVHSGDGTYSIAAREGLGFNLAFHAEGTSRMSV
jgi:hypothetical protein